MWKPWSLKATFYILHEVAEQLSSEGGDRKIIPEMLPELKPVLSRIRIQGQTFEGAETVIRRTCGCFVSKQT